MMVRVQQGSLETLTVCSLTPRQSFGFPTCQGSAEDKKLSFNSMTYGTETTPSVEMSLKARLLKEKRLSTRMCYVFSFLYTYVFDTELVLYRGTPILIK